MKSGDRFQEETDALTDLCQKQVNYWHSESPLTNEQVSAVMKIAKLAILHRRRGSVDFVRILEKG
jgi:hypothetical protein